MNVSRAALCALIGLVVVSACSDTATTPSPDEPAQVDILPQDARVLIGNQRVLTAEVRAFDGTVLSNVTPQWASSRPDIASVDAAGVVKAVGPGIAQIFATAGLGLDSAGITVPVPSGDVSSPGGLVLSSDGVVRLEVPESALQIDASITIVPARPDSLPAGSDALEGTAYEFGPAGLQFTIPATLTIAYASALTNDAEARRLRLHRLTGGTWVPLDGSTVDTDSTQVSGPITTFSIYGVAPVPNQTPTASISSPTSGTEVASGLAITFEGSASDGEDGTLTGESLEWTSSLDGVLGTGTTFTRSDLSIGGHVVTLTATDGDGSEGTAQVSITVFDGPPVVTILAPSADTVTKVGTQVVFKGSATDHVDGAIPADSLTWTSSIDGALGTGDSIATSSLSLGSHVVTLSTRDSQGSEGTATVTVDVRENEPPTVTILSPGTGASVGDRTGVTLQGTAIDPEDGTLSGASLVWSSNLDGVIGTGATLSSGSLTIGSQVVTLTATDSDGAMASASVSFTVFDEPPSLITPTLSFVSEAGGTITLSVTNSASFDNELFTLDASMPVCPGAPTPSRTWLEIYDNNGTLLQTYCDYDDRSDMASFTVTPADPPAQVYVELWSRVTGQRARSNSVTPVPSTPTTIAGVVVNDRDSDLNAIDPGEALAGVTIQLIVDTNADGIIDPGESVWSSTSTNSNGAYSFTNLWPRNYIVRAISPSNATVLRELAPDGTVLAQTGTLLTTGAAGAGATLNQSGTSQVGNTDPPAQGDELPRWGYALGTAALDGGGAPGGPGPNAMNGAVTTAPAHFTFLYATGGISGTVTTGGAGIAGARVTVTRCQTAPSAPLLPTAGACTQKHGSPSPHIANADTDASGSYSVSGLLEGVYQIEVAPATVGLDTVVTPGGSGTYLAVIRGDGDNAVVPAFVIS